MSKAVPNVIHKKLRHVPTGDIYLIRFENNGSQYNVFVEEHPDPGFKLNPVSSHILAGGRLCFQDRPVTFERTFALTLTWIDYFSEFIRTRSTLQKDKRVHVTE